MDIDQASDFYMSYIKNNNIKWYYLAKGKKTLLDKGVFTFPLVEGIVGPKPLLCLNWETHYNYTLPNKSLIKRLISHHLIKRLISHHSLNHIINTYIYQDLL